MKINILLILLFASLMCQAQTKLIAHKSHSGSVHSFSKAYQNNLFDVNCSNFGLPGNRNIVVVDTIMAVNDSITIVKMRESDVCYPYGTDYRNLEKSDFNRRTEKLINHKLFNKNNSVKLIKHSKNKTICCFYMKSRQDSWITFSNPIKKIVFIGFKE